MGSSIPRSGVLGWIREQRDKTWMSASISSCFLIVCVTWLLPPLWLPLLPSCDRLYPALLPGHGSPAARNSWGLSDMRPVVWGGSMTEHSFNDVPHDSDWLNPSICYLTGCQLYCPKHLWTYRDLDAKRSSSHPGKRLHTVFAGIGKVDFWLIGKLFS